MRGGPRRPPKNPWAANRRPTSSWSSGVAGQQVAPGIGQRAAAAQGHGNFQFIAQQAQHLRHAHGAARASTVSLPGGQIYENLVSGAIEATEWVGPYNDYFMKFYEAAKFYYWPGMHEPGAQLAMGINKTFWESLSPTDQAIIEAACNEGNGRTMAETNANNGVYLAKLISEHGVVLKEFNDEIYTAFGQAAQEVLEEARDHSDLSKRIMDSVVKARMEIGAWTALSDMSYVQKRNAVIGL
jgi:TRAP-type mannitol/chloroaromatic compound transport system substrate-binding protein